MGFLIDSNILIAAERQRINLEGLIQRYSKEPLAISAISASELLHGVHRARDAQAAKRRQAFVEFVLSTFEIIPFDLAAARKHVRIWAELQASGSSIGAHDLIIAATALAINYGVMTLNTGEFNRVPGLLVVGPEPPPGDADRR